MVTPADAQVRLRISSSSSRVTVSAEHRDDVIVEGASIETSADGAVEIRPERGTKAVEVTCPTGADVVVGTRSGGVELRGRFGHAGVTTHSGLIRVAEAAEVDLRTVSGSVQIDTCDGRCRIATTSGRITVGTTRDADISSMSASIAIDGASGAVEVRSVSGRVAIGSSVGGAVKVRTVSGAITIRVPSGARPAVRTTGLGKVRNSFEPGEDLSVDVAIVSGTVRLVPF